MRNPQDSIDQTSSSETRITNTPEISMTANLTSTSTSAVTSGSTHGPGETTNAVEPSSTDTLGFTSYTGDSTSTTTVNPCNDNCNIDVGTTFECDPFVQDCPMAQKCAPLFSNGWHYECVPLYEDPAGIGEVCQVFPLTYPIPDNCIAGAVCFDLDEVNYCIGLCQGDFLEPHCQDSQEICGNFYGLFVCYPDCTPLAPDCPANTVCAEGEGGFLCAPENNGAYGKHHQSCVVAGDCNEGLSCVGSETAIECDQSELKCCEPICDLGSPEPDIPCTGEGQHCVPYYTQEPVPVGLENLGICSSSL